MNNKIKLLIKNTDGIMRLEEKDGIIYKGFGILSWLSGGIIRPFVIHLKTGRIISMLCDEDINVVKGRIDSVENIIDPNMDYDDIIRILKNQD